MRSRRKHQNVLMLAVLAGLAAISTARADSPYATELISQNGAYGGAELYNDPYSVLGEPTSKAQNGGMPPLFFLPYHIKIVEPAYNVDMDGNKVITTLSRKSNGSGGYTYGSITVKFDHPVYDDPVNPYGIDLNVFGNAFYVGGGTDGNWVYDNTDMRIYYLAGGVFAEPVVISVSPDNVNWYTYSNGPYGDTAFPTQGYIWDAEQHGLTGNGWTDQKMDFTKPVNPALNSVLGTMSGPYFQMSTADAIKTYVGSGGGTGIDLAVSGFPWIQYVRVESTAAFRDGEIDAFSDVRPMLVGDDLSITPDNIPIPAGTAKLYFQNPEAPAQTLVRTDFKEVNEIDRVSTAFLSDPEILASAPQEVLVAYDLAVTRILGSGQPDFVADFRLLPGTDYVGDGTDLSVWWWNQAHWRRVPFVFDPLTGMALLEDWSRPAAPLVISRITCATSLPPDLDCDGDADSNDLAIFEACATGPAIPYDPQVLPPNCTLIPDGTGRIRADLDGDRDVDQSDFGIFQRCHSGDGIAVEPGCDQ